MVSRRRFVKFSAASLLCAHDALKSLGEETAILHLGAQSFHARGDNYSWDWSFDSDSFSLSDDHGRVVLQGSLQPAILVREKQGENHFCSPGTLSSYVTKDRGLIVKYRDVNKQALVTLTLRFDRLKFWLDPIIYESNKLEDVVSLHYFAKATDAGPVPSLQQTFLIHPGISMSSALSPVLPTLEHLDFTSWLGHGDLQGLFQQWGLPVHFFCGASTSAPNMSGSFKEHQSSAYCCGLAELPAADFLFQMKDGLCSPVLNIRSDLWHHARGPGRVSLGAPLCWVLGSDYREAIRSYYRELLDCSMIEKKVNSDTKNAVLASSAFDTWGAELAVDKIQGRFDEALLTSAYSDLKHSGMKAGTFIIDQKWEGRYGLLQHSVERFPHFEEFLGTLRQDGFRLGMWAAFIRCEDPHSVGLTIDHMLKGADGKPITKTEQNKIYFLYDVTQSPVEANLRARVKEFAEHYRPDLVKFDFGYELPSLTAGAPSDMNWAGERLLEKTIAVIVEALREVNPEIAVMYYSLSPLFVKYLDILSLDDLFLCAEDYAVEANRRFFFSNLLGEIGMPTFSSSGYDWFSATSIWFDAVVSGSIGSVNAFEGDEEDSLPTPAIMAKFNGLSQITRNTNRFSVNALDPVRIGSLSGAHSSSWLRLEGGEPVLLAVKPSAVEGGRSDTVRYLGAIETTASAVISSRDEKSIMMTKSLGIVPYGDGEVLIRHKGQARRAQVITHCLDKFSRKESVQLSQGALRLPLRERLSDGSLVEWLEIEIS